MLAAGECCGEYVANRRHRATELSLSNSDHENFNFSYKRL